MFLGYHRVGVTGADAIPMACRGQGLTSWAHFQHLHSPLCVLSPSHPQIHTLQAPTSTPDKRTLQVICRFPEHQTRFLRGNPSAHRHCRPCGWGATLLFASGQLSPKCTYTCGWHHCPQTSQVGKIWTGQLHRSLAERGALTQTHRRGPSHSLSRCPGAGEGTLELHCCSGC
jgi:hypothetical protein